MTMKEEWKVFIRGVDGRGNEIIKILTNLGGKNNSEWTDKYMSSYYIYIINHKGNISSVSINSETAKIIMDNYREMKLHEWKDGDVLFSRTDKSFSVYRKEKDNKSFICHIYISYDDCLFVNGWCCNKNYSLANTQEIEQFHELLHKHNKEWDAEKKQLIDWRWKPKMGENYFFIDSLGEIHESMISSIGNKRFFDFGNYFKTKEEAEVAAENIKHLLKEK